MTTQEPTTIPTAAPAFDPAELATAEAELATLQAEAAAHREAFKRAFAALRMSAPARQAALNRVTHLRRLAQVAEREALVPEDLRGRIAAATATRAAARAALQAAEADWRDIRAAAVAPWRNGAPTTEAARAQDMEPAAHAERNRLADELRDADVALDSVMGQKDAAIERVLAERAAAAVRAEAAAARQRPSFLDRVSSAIPGRAA